MEIHGHVPKLVIDMCNGEEGDGPDGRAGFNYQIDGACKTGMEGEG